MKRICGLAAGERTGLSGCALSCRDRAGRLPDDGGFDPDHGRAPRPTLPNVFVHERPPGRRSGADPALAPRRRQQGQTVMIAWALAGAICGPLAGSRQGRRPSSRRLRSCDCEVPRSQAGRSCRAASSYESRAQYKYTLMADRRRHQYAAAGPRTSSTWNSPTACGHRWRPTPPCMEPQSMKRYFVAIAAAAALLMGSRAYWRNRSPRA